MIRAELGWTAQLNLVCERAGPGFWAEPVNALTNGGFLLAAWHAGRRWRSAGGGDWPAALLIALLAAIGIGSFLFHTLATRWALAADLIPIQLFILSYFVIAIRRFLGLGALSAIATAAVFMVASHTVGDALAATFGVTFGEYVVPIAVVYAVGWAAGRRRNAAAARVRRLLLTAAGLTTLSTALAAFDLSVCPHLPIGTHGLWHLINAIALNRLAVAAIVWREASRASAGQAPAPAAA